MAVSPLTAQTQGNHKSNNVCACVCLCVFACACACTCLGVCVWKEEEEAINMFTWSECPFARVVLNKKLNHEQHKLIKPCSLEPYFSHVQKSNPQLLPLDEEMKKTPRNVLISQGWAEEKGNAHVKHAWPSALTCASHFAECVLWGIDGPGLQAGKSYWEEWSATIRHPLSPWPADIGSLHSWLAD